MPKNYGSKKTSGGGTGRQQAAGTPGMRTPGATPGGGGGTQAIYRGQPTATGERGHMAACGTPNELQDIVNKPGVAK